MIPRYSSPKIEKIWSLENKFSIWSKIECLVAEKLATNGSIPKKAAKDIRNNAVQAGINDNAEMEAETNMQVNQVNTAVKGFQNILDFQASNADACANGDFTGEHRFLKAFLTIKTLTFVLLRNGFVMAS